MTVLCCEDVKRKAHKVDIEKLKDAVHRCIPVNGQIGLDQHPITKALLPPSRHSQAFSFLKSPCFICASAYAVATEATPNCLTFKTFLDALLLPVLPSHQAGQIR